MFFTVRGIILFEQNYSRNFVRFAFKALTPVEVCRSVNANTADSLYRFVSYSQWLVVARQTPQVFFKLGFNFQRHRFIFNISNLSSSASRVTDRVRNSLPFFHTISYMHPVHNFPPCFPKIHSNIIFPSTSTSSDLSLPSRISSHNFVCVYLSHRAVIAQSV
jgi:hypothetical protein